MPPSVLAPAWAQTIVGLSVLVVALGVLWTKVVRPGLRAASSADTMLPLLQTLTVTFADFPDAFKVLKEMAEQFKTDSGSSLRDVVNRLDQAANENKHSAEILKIGVEASKLLAEQDRAQLLRLIVLLDRLTIKVDGNVQGVERIETAAKKVANDLDNAHQRADNSTGPAGEAADAFSRTEPTP